MSNMKAIQLDLFSGERVTTTAPAADLGGACPRGEVDGTLILNPCKACPLRGLCASDDCGMKLFPLDQDEPLTGTMEDWLSDWEDWQTDAPD